jgi:hypothetical protein
LENAKPRKESLARVDEPLKSTGEPQTLPIEKFQPEAHFAAFAIGPGEVGILQGFEVSAHSGSPSGRSNYTAPNEHRT